MKVIQRRGRMARRIAFMWLITVFAVLTAGTCVAREDEFEYWPDGSVRIGKRYNREGRLFEKVECRTDGSVQCRQWFDNLGNMIAEVNYDSHGRLDDNIRGYAAMRWFYKDGTLRVRTAYGEDGRLKERKLYTPGGNLIGTQYYDDDSPGDERDRFDPTRPGFSAAQYYDTDGNLIGTSAVDQ